MIEVYKAAPLLIIAKYRGISNTYILYGKAEDYCYCCGELVTEPCLLFSCLPCPSLSLSVLVSFRPFSCCPSVRISSESEE